MPLPTWDVFIGIAFLVGISYGFILRREKTITTLCSTYIGLVIATNFSEYLFQFFNGNKFIGNQIWIRSNASITTISIVVFLASIVFIAGAINSTNNRSGDLSPLEVIVYSALNIALIISAIIGFLPDGSKQGLLEASRVARKLFELRTLWIILPPIALIILNIKRRS